MKNLYAYTTAGVNYPPYISINEAPYGNENEVSIVVRGRASESGFCGGNTAEIILSKERARELGRALLDACNLP